MKGVILDSYAIMAFLENEEGAEDVQRVLDECASKKIVLAMSVVNLGEVYYSTLRARGKTAAQLAVDSVRALSIEIIDADWELTHIAADLKAAHGIAYADCFAAALAIRENAELVTGDKEFKQVEEEVSIRWIK